MIFIISPALPVPNKKLTILGKAQCKGLIALKYEYVRYPEGVNMLLKDVLGKIAVL